tara:strand:+ start:616 stop:834 length:219 start_codon:yes stop_codon:yes gene_type:complete
MTVLLTLTTAGTNADNFELYSNKDNFDIPFETGVSRTLLLSGYTSSVVPDYSTTVRVKANGVCINYVDILLQ